MPFSNVPEQDNYRKKGSQDECYNCPHKCACKINKLTRFGSWLLKHRKDIIVFTIIGGAISIILLASGWAINSCVMSSRLEDQNQLLRNQQKEACNDLAFAPSDRGFNCPHKFHKIESLGNNALICRCPNE